MRLLVSLCFARVRVCVCVYVCVRARARARVCVFVCVYVRLSVCVLDNRFVGLVVKVSHLESGRSGVRRSGVRIPLVTGFSGSSHTSDFKIGTPMATLPGVWRYRVSIGTGRPGVRIL